METQSHSYQATAADSPDPQDERKSQAVSNPKDETAEVYAFLGRRLRELRSARGLTQADVAGIINVSPQQYQKYEDAQSKCNLTYVIALAKYYGVHVNAILPVNEPVVETQNQDPVLPNEADLLARLVTSFVKMSDVEEKFRLVQLVEAIVSAHERKP